MSLREDAIAIWTAGVRAVDSERLVQDSVRCDRERLIIGDDDLSVPGLGRIEVVGAGKAGAGMARGLLSALAKLPDSVPISGWLNVPEDCVESLDRIHLQAARPAGLNEPTAAGVEGTRQILSRVENLKQTDLCIVLISGGGSALLPAPAREISLSDKCSVTRVLAKAGAPIGDLNIVRSQLSDVKGGGLLRHCRAGRLVALVISDVIGDPLEIIASGPTVPTSATPDDALQILDSYDPNGTLVPASVYRFLNAQSSRDSSQKPPCPFSNYVIGSNTVALSAAATEARQRGYEVVSLGSENGGPAAVHGQNLFRQLTKLKGHDGRYCILAGGETTVELAETNRPRRGGRNQEVVLAAVAGYHRSDQWQDVVLLSGGTDGEDGPTDAAGAVADKRLVTDVMARNICAQDYLSINDSYTFFDAVGGLLRTGPTHTNVMDLAVGLTGKSP